MSIANKVINRFSCDLRKPDGTPDCDVDFEYSPNLAPGEQWPQRIQIALMSIVQVSHPLTQGGSPTAPPNQPRFYCCRDHAVKALQMDQHLPAMPPKIVPATSNAEVKAAAAGARAVTEMKGPLVK